jgi:hypothetical protein
MSRVKFKVEVESSQSVEILVKVPEVAGTMRF